MLEWLAAAVNGWRLWRGECSFWGLRFAGYSFERWLYLRMHRLGRMGRDERATLERLVRPGMTVLDIGGNIGVYTVLLSRLVGPTGRVITFEPDPDLFSCLQANCARNGCANVEAHNLALGRQADRLVLRRLTLNSGDNTLGRGGSTHFRSEVAVEVAALDALLPALKPDLVKIDVQGWELEVLRGMERLLAGSPAPSLLLEFWPEGFRRAGYTAEDLVRFLLAYHYTLRLADQPEGPPLDSGALASLTRRLTHLQHADLYASR